MNPEQWTAVDRFFDERLGTIDAVLAEALDACVRAGLPAIQVSPAQAQMLHLLARATGARRILEIGTLGGFSAIALARALPADGRLVTLEFEPKHAEVARANLARAGLDGRVEVIVGPALATLPTLAGTAPFDLVFIDADKPSLDAYLEWALKLARPGALIVCDNVVRDGEILDPASTNAAVHGVWRLTDALAHDPRVSATVLQTVGTKGWDGFALALVTGAPARA